MAGGANLLRLRSQFDDQASPKLTKLRDNFDRLGKSKGAQTVLQGVGMGLGISAWGLLDRAIGFVGETIQGSIKAASDQREAMALNAQVFEQNSEAVKEWARNQDDAFSQTDAVTFASTFGTAFKNVGMALDEVTDKSKTLTTLAGDLSSTFNTASQDAAIALRSGLLGESEPLRKFGVFLDEAKVKAKAAAMGMEALGGKLTDGQKVAARYALIMEQTADSQGMFGRDTGSLADAQKRLESNMTDLTAELGEQLLPALVDLTNWVTEDGLPLLREFGGVWADLMNSFDPQPTYEAKTALGELDRVLTDVWSDALDVATVWDGWVSAADERKAAIDRVTAGMGDFRDADRDAAVATRNLSGKLRTAGGLLGDVGAEAADAADDFKKLEKAADDALDQFLDTALGPKELKLQLKQQKRDLKDNIDKLAELKGIKQPTRETRDDIIDTKLAIIDNKKEVVTLTTKLEQIDKVPLSAVQKEISDLGLDGQASNTAMLRLLGTLRSIDAIADGRTRGGGWGDDNFTVPHGATGAGWASGGFVPPGARGKVGEKGEETLVMFPGGGGYVIPNGGGQTGGGESTVVHTQINLDGREIARVVDRHLSYEAARAPRSASA